MQRRNFLAAGALSATAAALPRTAAAQSPAAPPAQYLEWRTYLNEHPDDRDLVSSYLETAAVPTWQRLGIGPVGVFTETGDDATAAIHVLLVYPSLAVFASAREALERDPEYQKNAVDYFAVAMDDPAFERITSTLLVPFAGMPQANAPAPKAGVYELRTYQSHNEAQARKKIQMFNSGEIEIFAKCGFDPVFFGESLVGPDLPNLKYMLAAPDMAANEAAWKKFIEHPDWIAMKDDAQYKDTVSKIVKVYLEPTPYSQI